MAEFPGLGKHCGVDLCNQLDFLPVRCDACKKTFCHTHFTYGAHSCEASYKKNVQVPVCPLCNEPVPMPRGGSADVIVNEHIMRQCQADPALANRKRIYSNKCSVDGCKKKELVPVTCPKCALNFCLAHRHDSDHRCQGKKALSNAALAAIARAQNHNQGQCSRQANSVSVSSISEDEALARALQESLNSGGKQLSPEELDRRLAEQMQREEYEIRRPQQQRNQQSCIIS